MFIKDSEIENLIAEDVPYIDLTSELLEIKEIDSKMEFFARSEMKVSCTEEASRIIEKLGGKVEFLAKSGTNLKKDEPILKAFGSSDSLLKAWKVSQNLIEIQSGIASQTEKLVKLAKAINPDVQILTTRKVPPLTKKFTIKSVIVGGASPHRLGLSETILVFKEHVELFGGFDKLITHLDSLKKKSIEKKIVIELKDTENLEKFANFDIIQFDKLAPESLSFAVSKLKSLNPNIKILSAGGINLENIQEYTATKVDGIVLSSLYYVKPKDVKVVILAV